MMARITSMTQKSIERPSLHQEIEATYSIIDIDGVKHLQIDSYGSSSRKIPGKTSQSLQFGQEGIAELRRILAELD